MASPFFDPTQWLPSPITTPFQPTMQPDAQQAITDILRRKQEEDEEEKLRAEKMLADLIERSRNKDEEARIQRLRSDMPQDIYNRMEEGYYGKNKVGKALLQIGSGLFGVAPDINKAAMDQWKTQQAAANSADTIQQREQAAAAGAISRMAQSQSRMKETEAKNQTAIAGKLIEAKVKDAKTAVDRMRVLGQQTGIDAKAALDAANTDLIKTWGALKIMGGFKDDGLLLTEYEKKFGKEAADRLAANMTGATLLEKYQPATPGGMSVTQAPLVNPQTGEVIGMKPPSTTMRTGRPAIGDPNVLMRMRGLPTNDAVNPGAPPLQQPAQPAAAPQGAMPQPRPQPGNLPPVTPTATAQPKSTEEWAKSIGKPSYRLDNFIAGDPANSLKAAAVPRGTFIGGVKPPQETGPDKVAREATNTFIGNAASLNQMFQDAYAEGKLQKQFNGWRSAAGMIGADKIWSEVNKRAGDPDTKSLELAFQALNTRIVADFLKKQSGAQVSEKEYGRLAQAYASGALDARGNLELSYINAVDVPAMVNLEKLGILNEGTAPVLGREIQSVSRERMKRYTQILDDMATKMNVTSKEWLKQKESYQRELKSLTSPEETIKEVLRRAFPDKVGGTLVIPDNSRNRDIHVYIPYGNKDMEDINRKRRRALADAELEKGR